MTERRRIFGGTDGDLLSGNSRPAQHGDGTDQLSLAANRYRTWLMDVALPIWWSRGVNRDRGGGYHDRLGHDGLPDRVPQRLRVQARQTFVYAEAGRLGWNGPWKEAVNHGLAAVLGPHCRSDGFYRASVSAMGDPVSDDVDLYDQSFVLLCLAAGWRSIGRPRALRDAAEQLVDRLRYTLGHGRLGFEEGSPRRVPLRANPHMHLLEAALAWIELGVDEPFTSLADDIVALATGHLIDRRTGAVGELFDGDWNFAAGADGRLREPGHQFEWAHLLDLHSRLVGGDKRELVHRLYRFGVDFGVERGIVLGAVDADGTPVERSSRLWAQTERLRTILTVGLDAGLATVDDALEAVAAIDRFIPNPRSGLWYDRCRPDGLPIVDAAPASSFYHIVTAFAVLIDGYCDGHSSEF